MMRKIGAVLGLGTLLVACGAESRRHGVGAAAGMGGAGAASGGSATTGGMTAAGGQGPISGPVCPEEEPEVGTACTSTAINCPYDVCDDETPKMFSCRGGYWQLARACGALDCPAERPAFLSDCAPLEGIECTYVEDCCGTDPATQSVAMRCESSRWTVVGMPEEACSFCRVQHEDGAACEQPSACSNVGCYWTSCYAQPLVEECVDGLWHSQTLCSK